ncbi:hypothetical protein C7E12_23585, partial [Stenotrophomonas maltophilia]
YALDAAFADTAKANLRERLKNYATSYAAGIDFTGYALDAAFADTAKANLRERLKNYATSYAAGIDFT